MFLGGVVGNAAGSGRRVLQFGSSTTSVPEPLPAAWGFTWVNRMLKLALWTISVVSAALSVLLAAVCRDMLTLSYPGWMRLGIVASMLFAAMIGVLAVVSLWRLRNRTPATPHS